MNKIKTKQVYINDVESTVKECSAFEFNVEEKVTQTTGESNAFRFCKSCIYNDGSKIISYEDMYFVDETFKLCFPKQTVTELNSATKSFILTEAFLNSMSAYAIFTAIILFLITPAILMPTNTSVLFYSFWELL